MKLTRTLLFLSVFALMAGCVSIYDRSEKYRAFIGQQFVTRYEVKLCRMKRHNYDIVPYCLEPIGSSVPDGKVVATIPAGTVITVRDAKVSYVGGDWDILIGELRLPGTNAPIVFEEMLGFSSVDPKEFYRRYTPLNKNEEPNQALEPTASSGRGSS